MLVLTACSGGQQPGGASTTSDAGSSTASSSALSTGSSGGGTLPPSSTTPSAPDTSSTTDTSSTPVDPAAQFVVAPTSALSDEPVSTTIENLPAGATVTVTADAVDTDGTTWESWAVFRANAAGTVSLGQPPTVGPWTGVNAMGLFSLMRPKGEAKSTEFVPPPGADYTVHLTAAVNGATVAETTVQRAGFLSVDVSVRLIRIDVDGIYGDLFEPAHPDPRKPAVLMIGGGSGGLADDATAGDLAAQGYPTLSLAYFKEPGLPGDLQSIPLEYFQKALTLLADQPGVDPHRIFVFGVDRGAEAALLVGATYPQQVYGVVAGSPTSLVFGGSPDAKMPAWTLGGKPVTFAPATEMTDPTADPDPAAVIPVERIRGPILTVCGTADTVWASCTFADDIRTRLAATHGTADLTQLRYDDAGHGVGDLAAYVSTTSNSGGGKLAATQAGRAAAHAEFLQLLARAAT
jgi:dienelactone hydrolase